MPRFWWLKALLVVLFLATALAWRVGWWPFNAPGFPDASAPQQVCPAPSAQGQPAPAALPYNPAGPAYTGPGPHPIVVVDRVWVDRQLLAGGQLPYSQSGGDELTGLHLPEQWRSAALENTPAEQGYGSQNRSEVQLVACVYYAALGAEERMCKYYGSAVLLHSATYTVVVRAARTAREVATFDLASRFVSTERREPEFIGCPKLNPPSSTRSDRTMPPVNAEFRDALRPLVEQSRPG
ncbi:hypothetical protein [Crossiella sp. CA198]|uniref:hypothetical protein n=1 Tax=Crossiella sp. CA198 TaxID=3455607 RepID=UPI003F8D5D86